MAEHMELKKKEPYWLPITSDANVNGSRLFDFIRNGAPEQPNDLRRLAEQRAQLHENHASSRPLSDDYEFVGLAGEEEFAWQYGLEVDRTSRPAGDKGIDFIHSAVGSIDVKTARKAYNLIVEKGKVYSNIYVLARYNDTTQRAELLGWATRQEVLAAPVKDFGYGVFNHYIPVAALRSMSTLKLE